MNYQSPNQNIQGQKGNWKQIIFWGIILGLIIFALYKNRESILTFVNKPTIDFNWFQTVNLDNILTMLQKYAPIITLGAAAFTFVYGMYQKHKANQVAQQLLTTKLSAQSEVNDAYTMAEKYRQEAENYQLKYEQSIKPDNNDVLVESQKLVQSQADQIRNLQNDVQTYRQMLIDLKTKQTTVTK